MDTFGLNGKGIPDPKHDLRFGQNTVSTPTHTQPLYKQNRVPSKTLGGT